MGRKRSNFHKPAKAHGLALQQLHIQHRFPDFSYQWISGEGIWRGKLQPHELSAVYELEIRYRLGKIPQIRVLSPALESNAPHLYREGTLCLYWPKEWTWRGDCLIAETILPWAALWLYYYELWLDTGKWLAPSSHDRSPAPKTK
jgi:hypothetical protein